MALRQLGLGFGPRVGGWANAQPMMTPDEEQGLFSQIGDAAISGIGAIGNLLDLPGSMVRDILAWENPLDQLLTPFGGDNRVYGRDLLEKLGVQKNAETGLSGWLDDPMEAVRDIGGFGVDVLFDPLSYLTLGGAALTKSGEVAKRAGLIDNARFIAPPGVGPRVARQTTKLEDLIRAAPRPDDARGAAVKAANAMGLGGIDELVEPLGRSFGYNVPFTDIRGAINLDPLGLGGVDRFVAGGLDKVGGAIANSRPGVFVRGLLSRESGGFFDPIAQEMKANSRLGEPSAIANARMEGLNYREALEGLQPRFLDEAGDAISGGYASSQYDPRDIAAAMDEAMAPLKERWELEKPLREFRGKNPEFVQWFRQGRDAADDAVVKKRFDEEAWGLINAHPELGISTPDDLVDILREGAMPRPSSRSPESIRAAEQIIDRNMRKNNPTGEIPGMGVTGEQYPFGPADVVEVNTPKRGGRWGDNAEAAIGKRGVVRRVGPTNSEVFFRNEQTGETWEQILPNKDLKSVAAKGTPEATAYGNDMTLSVMDDIIRATRETGDVREAFAELAPEMGMPSPELAQQIEEIAALGGGQRDASWKNIERLGGNARMLQMIHEGGEQHPRFINRDVAEASRQKGRTLPAETASMKGRREEIARLPQFAVNRIVKDQRYRGPGAANRILRDFDDVLDPTYGPPVSADPMSFDFGANAGAPVRTAEESKRLHAEALADWVSGRPTRSMFTNTTIEDHLAYLTKAHAVENGISSIHNVFHRYAQEGAGDVSLVDAFRRAGLNADQATAAYAERFGVAPDAVKNMYIPESVVNGARHVTDYLNKGPEWQGQIGRAVDKFTQWFKESVTVPFPSFIARNFLSGQHVNLTTGLVKTSDDIRLYGDSMKESVDFIRRAQKDPASLTAAERSRLKEYFAYNIVDPNRVGNDVELIKNARPKSPILGEADFLQEYVPPRPFKGASDFAREEVADKPFVTDRLGKRATQVRTQYRKWVRAGSNLSRNAEFLNRVPLYEYLKKKGYTPAQAAQEVKIRQFDYGDVTPFERSVMKRLFPFWGFSSNAAPMISKALIERPGGGLAQTIRASTQAGGSGNEPLPQYIEQTAAIPLGDSPDGGKSFITGFGLAHEDPLAFFGGSLAPGKLLQDVGVELASRSNPLVKAPLEWLTGESFFQRGPMGGRDLADMDPALGRLLTNAGVMSEDPISGRAHPALGSPLLEHVAMNSPFSRMFTTARQLTDDRKSWGDLGVNLLTGIRQSDISPAALDAVLRDRATEIAMGDLGGRSFENVYIPAQAIEQTRITDPAQAARMEAYNKLKRLLSQRAKQRKAAEQ